MTIAQPIKLLVIGSSLISTNSLWFFDYYESPKISPEDNVNINAFDPVDKLPNPTRAILEDSKFIKGTEYPGLGFNFTYETKTKKLLRNDVGHELENLELKYYKVTRKEYSNIGRSEIQIRLFDRPVGSDETQVHDIYQDPIKQEQIDQLFENKDDIKVKQLLLSLNLKRNGIKLIPTTAEINYYSHLQQLPTYEKELKNLKIKYFTDFSKLKEYVHRKVDSCTDNSKACVAHLDELNIMNTDLKTFFEK